MVKPHLSSLAFAAAAVMAVSWPFIFVSIPDDDILIDVKPGKSVVLSSPRRGMLETAEFLLVNRSIHDISLEVSSKSCACIGITLEHGVVGSGAQALVTAKGRVPITGISKNSFTLLARELVDTGATGLEGTIHLGYSIESIQQSPVEIYPSEIQMTSAAWGEGGQRLLTVRVRDGATPGEVTLAPGNLVNAKIEPYGEWAGDDNGVFSRRYRLTLAPCRSPASARVVSLQVKRSDAAILDIGLPCSVTSM